MTPKIDPKKLAFLNMVNHRELCRLQLLDPCPPEFDETIARLRAEIMAEHKPVDTPD